jgi:hypothetical protein
MLQTVYIAHQSSVAASGQPTWGSPSAFPARVEDMQRVEDGPGGKTIMTRSWVLLDSSAAIVQGDRLWLPGVDQTNGNLARRVNEITALPAIPPATGIDHYEVIV